MPPTVKKAFKRFLVAAEVEHRSAGTLRWYRILLRPFVKSFKGVKIGNVSADAIRSYVLSVQNRKSRFTGSPGRPMIAGGPSVEYVRSHIRAIRRFINWSWNEFGLPLDKNPMRFIKMPPRADIEPKAISVEIIRRLLEVCGDTPRGRRDGL